MNVWPSKKNIREAQFAGQFYTEDKIKLEQQLDDFFDDVNLEKEINTPDFDKNHTLRALISPHAGYVFSGQIAAKAIYQIPSNAKYKRIFILASSHRYSFNGAAVYCNGNYRTPLGEIGVDTKLSKILTKKSNYFVNHENAHVYEHSIEVQLPFLQHHLPKNIEIVPIIIGTQSKETCREIANQLKPYFTKENLFLISTDFSHYPDYENAVNVDKLTADAICSNNPEELLSTLKRNKNLKISNLATSLCGWTSVLTLLYLTEKSNLEIHQLKYMNSGDARLFSDKKRVVGYWAMSVVEKDNSFQISEEEKKEILHKARSSIETYVKTRKRGNIIKSFTEGILNEQVGVFVSVYVNEKLRGCVGGFAQEKTLNELVQNMAISASCDRRFDSIQVDELENMELEISVLSPLKKIDSINEIELGKHGIYIRSDIHSGTFLPQVATKTGWNLEEFLGRCSRDKAGLGWEGWKTAELFTYEAVIFRGKG